MQKQLKKKVAIVYDRVNKWGGAERVLLAIHEMFPEAPLYTSVYDSKQAKWAKVFPSIKTSFLQNIPFAKNNHEFLATFMSFAFESFDFSDFDLVISVTSEAAKGIKIKPGTVHICYCLTPTRYLWSHYDEYFKDPAFKAVTKPIVSYLKWWDKKAAGRPDKIIAISTEVQKRISKYYKRDSEIIFPPVEVVARKSKSKKYYLLVSRLDYGYKKVDLAIKAFNKLQDPLVIVGAGREKKKLMKIAKPNIKFVGKVSEKRLSEYYRHAIALIMPQEEDFGIVAVEAQGRSVPVIAYKKGGALDTVVDGKTGVLFKSQTVKSLMQGVEKFAKMRFSERILRTNARKFSKTIFKRQLQEALVRTNFGRRRRHASLAKVS
ncbi:MAG TPA: glycosyltransferase [Patescibacteria group bacterium]|nr:glycosyltransferase [Patescibacteria group bacterium]